MMTYNPFLMQCAAVKTWRDVIKDPEHVYATSNPFLYPSNAIHGYAPILASVPPTIRGADTFV